jgi:hypothetical protein
MIAVIFIISTVEVSRPVKGIPEAARVRGTYCGNRAQGMRSNDHLDATTCWGKCPPFEIQKIPPQPFDPSVQTLSEFESLMVEPGTWDFCCVSC